MKVQQQGAPEDGEEDPPPGGDDGGGGGGDEDAAGDAGAEGDAGGDEDDGGGGGGGGSDGEPDAAEAAPSGGPSISRRALFALIHPGGAQRPAQLAPKAAVALGLDTAPRHIQQRLKIEVERFFYRFTTRWKRARYTKERFLRANSRWLDGELSAAAVCAAAERAQVRQEQKMKEQAEAAAKAAEAAGEAGGATGYNFPPPGVATGFPGGSGGRGRGRGRGGRGRGGGAGRGSRGGKVSKYKSSRFVTYTAEEVLDNLIIAAKMSKRQYEIMRECAIGVGCHIYPSFTDVQMVMKERALAGVTAPQVPMGGVQGTFVGGDSGDIGDIEDNTE